MPTAVFTLQDGTEHRISVPEGTSQADAWRMLQQELGRSTIARFGTGLGRGVAEKWTSAKYFPGAQPPARTVRNIQQEADAPDEGTAEAWGRRVGFFADALAAPPIGRVAEGIESAAVPTLDALAATLRYGAPAAAGLAAYPWFHYAGALLAPLIARWPAAFLARQIYRTAPTVGRVAGDIGARSLYPAGFGTAAQMLSDAQQRQANGALTNGQQDSQRPPQESGATP